MDAISNDSHWLVSVDGQIFASPFLISGSDDESDDDYISEDEMDLIKENIGIDVSNKVSDVGWFSPY